MSVDDDKWVAFNIDSSRTNAHRLPHGSCCAAISSSMQVTDGRHKTWHERDKQFQRSGCEVRDTGGILSLVKYAISQGKHYVRVMVFPSSH